jgi:hypothetical protein
VSSFIWNVGFRPTGIVTRFTLSSVVGLALAAHCCMAQQPPAKANPFAKPEDEKRPDPIAEFKLDRVLPTVAVAHDRPRFNVHMVSAALLPRDKQGIWVLDFSFKSLRIVTVDIPGKGRRQIHYLYYKVINRTGAPRMFAPQFIMVNEEKGEKIEDSVLTQAIPLIQAREDAAIPVLGAVNVVGMIPPSTKANIDDAVFGVAVWEKWDKKSDRFSIYVRGLSDGYKEVPSGSDGKPVAKYKTLKIDFIRRGDEHNINENEIELRDPPYEWVYW